MLSIVGGASGVGKTSLLRSFADIKQINTGDLFKSEMTLGNRDEIKKGNWTVFETSVTTNMIQATIESIQRKQDLIIDTHFGAKIYNREYRIGLKEEYLYQFGCSVLGSSVDNITIKVVLVTTDPFLLLTRRRMDQTRDRELVPSDCYNDLRNNDIYSLRYFSALRRAEGNLGLSKGSYVIEYHVVENVIFDSAQEQMNKVIRR